MVAIDVSGLTKDYGPIRALRGLDLTIRGGGGIVGLLGPNGAGKTTFVEVLEGLRPATTGRVRVLGLDPAVHPRQLAARIGVMLQSTAFAPELTVLETLRLYAALHPSPRPPVEVAALVGLADRLGARVRTLSGGQRQRLALALAMLPDPKLLILDEPTSGLDPVARRAIHDLLVTFRAEGRTVLLSSHYLDEIEALADRVLVLSAGSIVADGTPLELLARAEGRSTIWLGVDGVADPAALLPGAVYQGRDAGLHRFVTGCPTAAIVSLAEALRATGARLDDLRLKRPSLEDFYLQLVGEAPARAAAADAALQGA